MPFMATPVCGCADRRLLSKAYAAERRSLIDRQHAWPEMPPPGQPRAPSEALVGAAPTPGRHEPDTSYVCVVDQDGNAFSATPSDAPSTPIIPELGFIVSSRGYQAWLDPEHPSAVAPGKRPRLTPSPGLVLPGRVGDALRYAQQRPPTPGDGPVPGQPDRFRPGPPAGGRGAARGHLQLSSHRLPAPVRSGPAAGRSFPAGGCAPTSSGSATASSCTTTIRSKALGRCARSWPTARAESCRGRPIRGGSPTLPVGNTI